MITELATRYAQGLFELAQETNTVEEKKEQAELLLQVAEENPDLTVFFNAVKVTGSEKKEFILNVFQGKIEQDMVNFLRLLVDKHRIVYLKDILKAYISLADEELGIEHAEVYSARKLPEEELAKIKSALETKTGKQIVLRNVVDESLIAGIKVVVGNNVTDVTMKNKIDSLRETLLKGGQA